MTLMTLLNWVGFLILVIFSFQVSVAASALALFATANWFASWKEALLMIAVSALLWWVTWWICPFYVSVNITAH